MALKMTREQVIAQFKNSPNQDTETIAGVRDGILAEQKPMQLGSTAFIVIGAILTVSIIGIFPGLPLLIGAIYVKRCARRNKAIIEAAYGEYVARGTGAAGTGTGVAGVVARVG